MVALTGFKLDLFRGISLLSDGMTGMCPQGRLDFSLIAKIYVQSFALEISYVKILCRGLWEITMFHLYLVCVCGGGQGNQQC